MHHISLLSNFQKKISKLHWGMSKKLYLFHLQPVSFYLRIEIKFAGMTSFNPELKCRTVMFAVAVFCVQSGFQCRTASRPGQLLISMAGRRLVVSGSLGRLGCSLIDGLSLWSNYPEPHCKAGDLVVSPNQTHCKIKTIAQRKGHGKLWIVAFWFKKWFNPDIKFFLDKLWWAVLQYS